MYEKSRAGGRIGVIFSISQLPSITEFLLSHLGEEWDNSLHIIVLIAGGPHLKRKAAVKRVTPFHILKI